MTISIRHKLYQSAAGVSLLVTSLPAFAEPHDLDVPEAQQGLPQLNAETYTSQIFWLVVFFVLLYLLMSKMALPRVSEVLEIRESNINDNLTRAEKLQAEMETVKAEYEKALTAAHTDAQAVMKKIDENTSKKVNAEHAAFAEKARKRLDQSENNIKAAKEEALKSLEDIAVDITKDAVKKVSGITVTKDNARKAVQTRIKEVA